MTDHTSEARWLVDGKNQPASTYDLHNPEADLMVATAQVHATLALVEQQRIANLIALADMAGHEFGAYAGIAGPFGTVFDRPETEHGNMRLKPEIAAALGLTIGDDQ